MSNIFDPRADVLVRLSLAALGVLAVGSGVILFVYGNSSWSMDQYRTIGQPVMFSHEHHTGVLGLDCRYCHQHAEDSDFAGIPTPETCMGCHLQLYPTAAMLEPVRTAWRDNEPLAWNRVYRLPDFVYFSHKVHVRSGVACVSCHGRLDEQSLTRQETPLTMGWCLDCHRQPERRLVDLAKEFDPAAEPGSPEGAGSRIDRVELLSNCSACHY